MTASGWAVSSRSGSTASVASTTSKAARSGTRTLVPRHAEADHRGRGEVDADRVLDGAREHEHEEPGARRDVDVRPRRQVAQQLSRRGAGYVARARQSSRHHRAAFQVAASRERGRHATGLANGGLAGRVPADVARTRPRGPRGARAVRARRRARRTAAPRAASPRAAATRAPGTASSTPSSSRHAAATNVVAACGCASSSGSPSATSRSATTRTSSSRGRHREPRERVRGGRGARRASRRRARPSRERRAPSCREWDWNSPRPTSRRSTVGRGPSQ